MMGRFLRRHVFTRENGIALLLCLAAIVLLITLTDTASQWIYQGF